MRLKQVCDIIFKNVAMGGQEHRRKQELSGRGIAQEEAGRE